MPRVSQAFPLVCALFLLAAPAAKAAHFDFIYPDRFDLTLCTNGCGLTLAGTGFGLIVNEGVTDIGHAEMFSASFSATSSHPEFTMDAFVNDPNFPVIAPIHPQEAVGSVSPFANNAVLLTQLHPGETHRNTYDAQFLAFNVTRVSGSYEGPVQFNVTMAVGGEEVQFVMLANVHVGESTINFTSAARTASVPLPVPAARTSWGKVKALYH